MLSSGDIDLSQPSVDISGASLNTVTLIFNLNPDTGSRYTLTGPNGPELDPFGLVAGQYILSLSGTTDGVGGSATYSGTIHANYTAAIPEPSTYALMLLGLAGIGFVARRRMAGTVRT